METADKGYLLLKALWGFLEGMKTKLFRVALHNVEPCLHLPQAHTSPNALTSDPLAVLQSLVWGTDPLAPWQRGTQASSPESLICSSLQREAGALPHILSAGSSSDNRCLPSMSGISFSPQTLSLFEDCISSRSTSAWPKGTSLIFL